MRMMNWKKLVKLVIADTEIKNYNKKNVPGNEKIEIVKFYWANFWHPASAYKV